METVIKMRPSIYARLLMKYFLLIIIIFAVLQMFELAVDNRSSLRNYEVYSKFSWVDIKETVPVSLREDKRGLPGCKQKTADVIMIGVPKCGTGAVRYSLGEHPEIAMDLNSEGVQYFSTRFHRGKLWYISQMPCVSNGKQLTVENSVQYFVNEIAPSRISNFNPRMKLILTVRNPIDRLVSDFLQMKVGRPYELIGETFEENVFDKETGNVMDAAIVSKSLYSVHLKRWLEYFKIGQIHVVNGDAFLEDPVSELKQIETFLGIEPHFDYNQFAYVQERGAFCFQRTKHVECLESGKGRKHPNLSQETIKKLKDYFRPYNDDFFSLIGRDIHWND